MIQSRRLAPPHAGASVTLVQSTLRKVCDFEQLHIKNKV